MVCSKLWVYCDFAEEFHYFVGSVIENEKRKSPTEDILTWFQDLFDVTLVKVMDL